MVTKCADSRLERHHNSDPGSEDSLSTAWSITALNNSYTITISVTHLLKSQV